MQRPRVQVCHEPPKPGVLETFQTKEKEGTDAGGGTVAYEPENRGLYLSRDLYPGPERARLHQGHEAADEGQPRVGQ